MSTGGFLTTLGQLLVGTGVGSYVGWVLIAAGAVEMAREQRKARRRQIDAYNASLADRLQSVDYTGNNARRLVLGRTRLAGQHLRRPFSHGTNLEQLTMVLEFAGHEIDAFEAWYADDTELTLDGSGYVQTAPWLKTRTEAYTQNGTLDGSGGATVTLDHTPAGAVMATATTGSGESLQTVQLSVAGSGGTRTLSGGSAGAAYEVVYDRTISTPLMRIRPYTGTALQSVGGDHAAEYGAHMRATDHYRGIALALVDLTYDQDVYTSGPPVISAVLRGAKVLDPRDATTAWSDNSALLAYHYARHANGLAVPADEIVAADVEADADVCDTSTDFTLTQPGGGTSTVTLPRYTCGMVVPTDADPREAYAEIVETMAGRFGWAGGKLRTRCGALRTPVFEMDQSWLWRRVSEGGSGDSGPVMRITNGTTRENQVNAVTGRCVDADQRYQLLPFPRYADDVLVAAQGEYGTEVEYGGVTHIAQAQHLASIAIRSSQAALRAEATCALHAYRCELFDTGTLTLPRYGMAAKAVEVVGWRWHPAEGVTLRLAEITADMFSPVAELTGRDPATNSNLPRPWEVEDITGVAVDTNTTAVTDGAIVTRLVVTWDQATTTAILSGGQIEVQYAVAGGEWQSWTEQGASVQAVIPGVLANRAYLVRVRAVQLVPYVRGDWSAVVVHIADTTPLVGTGGIAAGAATEVIPFAETGSFASATLAIDETFTVPAGCASLIVSAQGSLTATNGTAGSGFTRGWLKLGLTDPSAGTHDHEPFHYITLPASGRADVAAVAQAVVSNPAAGTWTVTLMWDQTTGTTFDGELVDPRIRVEIIKR